jgi:uncharacterized iron-regulated protein
MKYQGIFPIVILLLQSLLVQSQKPAYTLFSENGKTTRYEKMVKASAEADIVLFGELHNNPIAHWLQYELTKDLHNLLGEDLMMGAEMFEADGQLIMDEYFSGMITTEKFEDEMRLWNNYKTDYKPLLEFAKDSGLRFVATNIPRRYANMVFKLGLDSLNSLSAEALNYMMPLPLEYDTTLECYASLAGGGVSMGGHGSPNLRDAQAVKDATMSHFILRELKPGKTFLHFNGAYHSDNFESMVYFIQKENPGLKLITISTVSQEHIETLEEENVGKANFIISVPESMTTTY